MNQIMILNAKDLYETKYQLLVNKRENTSVNYLNGSKALIKYSVDIDGIYKNIEEYNPSKKRKMLIVFDEMIPDMLSNKKLHQKITDLFLEGKK